MPKPAQILWVIECKWHRQGRGWEVSLDHIPFRHEEAAKDSCKRAETDNVGWQYRATKFVREDRP